MNRFDEQHEIFSGIPTIHQNEVKWQLLLVDYVDQHLLYMIEFAFAISVGITNAVVEEPEPIEFRVNVNAGDYADPFDHTVIVAAILAPHELDGERIVLFKNGIVKDQIPVWRPIDLALDVFPDQSLRDFLSAKVAIYLQRARIFHYDRQSSSACS